jgi:hypothetical protein
LHPSSATDCIPHQLLKLRGDSLANALRTLPTRCGDFEALLEKAHEYKIADKTLQGPLE